MHFKRSTKAWALVILMSLLTLSWAALADAPGNIPSQITMTISASQAEGASSLQFQWVMAPEVEASQMEYWAAEDQADKVTLQAERRTPNPEDSITPENIAAHYKPISVFTVDVEGLVPGTTYHYRLGSDALGFTEDLSFVAPAAAGDTSPFTFLMNADTQSASPEGFKNVNLLYDHLAQEESDAAFLIHVGDVVEDAHSSDQWQYFFDAAKNLSAKIPMMVTPGNHDGGSRDSRFEQFRARLNYTSAARQPEGLSDNLKGTVYAFDYGDALFICLNSITENEDKEVQIQFLRDECAKTDKAWKIVYTHYAIYNPFSNHAGLDNKMGKVMTEAGVDLVLNGHAHGYSRVSLKTVSEAAGNAGVEKSVPGEATTYIIGGSVSEYASSPGMDLDWNDVLVDIRKGDGSSRIHAPGVFSKVRVTPNTLNYAAYYKATGEDKPFRVIDEFTLQKTGDAIRQPAAEGQAPHGVTYLLDSFGQEDGQLAARFNWTTDPKILDSQLFYAKKADFEANGGKFTHVVNGTSDLVDLRPSLENMQYQGMDEQYSVQARRSHKAETPALEAGTEYVYCVGDGNRNMSAVASFTMPDAKQAAFSFNWFTDTQQNDENYEKTVAAYQEHFGKVLKQAFEDFPKAEFILLSGDQVNYGFDTWEWDAFFEAGKEYFSRLPLYLGVGNHEFDGAGNEWAPGESWDPVDATLRSLHGRFNAPKNGAYYYGAGEDGQQPIAAGVEGRMFEAGNYFFKYKDTLFLFIDFKDQAKDEWLTMQQNWIKSVVKQNPARWRVAVLHKSLFGYRMDQPIPSWTDTMDAAGIDLVLMGHDHVYIRTKPYQKGAFGETGTVYITNASGNTDARGERLASMDAGRAAYQAVEAVGPAFANISISPEEIRITAKAFDANGQLKTLEDNVTIASSPLTPDLAAYAYPEAAKRVDDLTITELALTGYAKEGQTLATEITPKGATAAYRWEVSDDGENWQPIAGVDGDTYALSAEHVGRHLRCVATGTDFYNGEATSAAIGPVSAMVSFVGDPIAIGSADDLKAFAEGFGKDDKYPTSAQYLLTADIDLQGITLAPIGGGEAPVPFFGTLDGQGYTISNLTIASEHDATGLFAYIAKGATVANLRLDNLQVTGKSSTGSIAGASSGTIRNCAVTGTIQGEGYTGGLVGTLHGGIAANNVVNAAITCQTGGGLIGGTNFNGAGSPIATQESDMGTIVENNYILGTIEGQEYYGAIVGDMGGSSGNPLRVFTGNIAANKVIGAGEGLLAGYWSGSREILTEGAVNCYLADTLSTKDLKEFVVPAFKEISAQDLEKQDSFEALGWNFTEGWDWADNMPLPRAAKLSAPQDDMITLLVTSGNHGSIAPSGNVLVKRGESVTFDLKPDEYFEIDQLLVDGKAAEPAEQLTLEGVDQLHSVAVTYKLRADAGGTPPKVVSTEASYVRGSGKHFLVTLDFGTGALGIIEDTRHSVESCKIYDQAGNMIFDLDSCFWIPGAKYGRPANELEICYDDMEKRTEYANLLPGEYELEIELRDLNKSTFRIPLYVTSVEEDAAAA